MATSPRVLIITEHASMKFGGEAAIPFHLFRYLRAHGVEAWMVTHARTKAELEAQLPSEIGRVHFVPDTGFHRFCNWFNRKLPGRIAHFTFGLLSRLHTQRMARSVGRRLVKEHRIDIVHQPIPVSPKDVTLLHTMGAPVIIGPMNGAMSYPPGFASRESAWVIRMYGVIQAFTNLVQTIIPGKRRAAALLVANERTRAALPSHVQGQIIVIPENGVDLDTWQPRDWSTSNSASVTRFVFVGRLVALKGLDLFFEAMTKAFPNVHLDIIGRGPDGKELEHLAKKLGLSERVTFHGFQPQTACAKILRDCDVFVLPSLHECGGAAVLEAMAVGLPVITTNWGGPADYVNASCGILVDPVDRPIFIQGLADAINRLAGDPELRKSMGIAGRARVLEHFDWNRKIDAMLDIYRSVLGPLQLDR